MNVLVNSHTFPIPNGMTTELVGDMDKFLMNRGLLIRELDHFGVAVVLEKKLKDCPWF